MVRQEKSGRSRWPKVSTWKVTMAWKPLDRQIGNVRKIEHERTTDAQ